MSKQCTKPKRKRDAEWFKDKVLLVQAQANGQIYRGRSWNFSPIQEQQSHQAITLSSPTMRHQADELDAYDSDCDEINSAKIALMAN
nr:hypothetical protein [Tanacetum cinerariifolium]